MRFSMFSTKHSRKSTSFDTCSSCGATNSAVATIDDDCFSDTVFSVSVFMCIIGLICLGIIRLINLILVSIALYLMCVSYKEQNGYFFK